MVQLINYSLYGWPDDETIPVDLRKYATIKDEIIFTNGVLYKGDRIIIPKDLRTEVMDKLHSAHQGSESIIQRARDIIYWPDMAACIRTFTKDCNICKQHSVAQQALPMLTPEVPTHPFEIVSKDICELTFQGKKYTMLVTVDHFSDFFEVNFLNNTTADTIMLLCKQLFARYGIPQILITDNATYFVNEKFKNFSSTWSFCYETTFPYNHKSNGKIEATNKLLKSILSKALADGKDIYLALLEARNTTTPGKITPAQRFLARNTRTLIPIAHT